MKLTVKTMNEDPAGYQCWISINSDAVVFGLLVFWEPNLAQLAFKQLGEEAIKFLFLSKKFVQEDTSLSHRELNIPVLS